MPPTGAERGRVAGVGLLLAAALAGAEPAAAQWRGRGDEAHGGGYAPRGARSAPGGWAPAPAGMGGWRGAPRPEGRFTPEAYRGGAYRGQAERGDPYGPPPAYRVGPYGPPAYAPPPSAYGGRAWRRGEVLPQGYRGAAVPDPGRYHLRRAPNGYDWVGDARNAYLMQRSTGLVLDSVPGAYEPPPPYRGRRPR